MSFKLTWLVSQLFSLLKLIKMGLKYGAPQNKNQKHDKYPVITLVVNIVQPTQSMYGGFSGVIFFRASYIISYLGEQQPYTHCRHSRPGGCQANPARRSTHSILLPSPSWWIPHYWFNLWNTENTFYYIPAYCEIKNMNAIRSQWNYVNFKFPLRFFYCTKSQGCRQEGSSYWNY